MRHLFSLSSRTFLIRHACGADVLGSNRFSNMLCPLLVCLCVSHYCVECETHASTFMSVALVFVLFSWASALRTWTWGNGHVGCFPLCPSVLALSRAYLLEWENRAIRQGAIICCGLVTLYITCSTPSTKRLLSFPTWPTELLRCKHAVQMGGTVPPGLALKS